MDVHHTEPTEDGPLPLPDRQEAERFIAALTGSRNTPVVFQTFVEPKAAPCEAFPYPETWRGTISDSWDKIDSLNKSGHGIFVQVNEGEERGAANVTGVRAVFLDDDSGELEPCALTVKPSFVVQSAHGIHPYWRIRPEDSGDLDKFTSTQKALAAVYDTDKAVSNLDRVMRLPGTLHLKDRAHPFLVRTIQIGPSAYGIAEVVEAHGQAAITAIPATVKPPTVTATGTTSTTTRTPVVESMDRILTRARAYLATIPGAAKGSRNQTAFRVAAALTRDFALPVVAALPLIREWNERADPPLPDVELEGIAMNASRYGKGVPGALLAGVTFPEAGGAEVMNPEKETVVDPLPAALRSASQLLDTKYPPLEFVCRPYIPKAEVIEIVGPHGSFKSTIALDLCLAVACGRPWGGMPVVQGKSAFITMEDREAVVAHRVLAYLAGIDDDTERERAAKLIRENFAFLAREEAQALALTSTDRSGTFLRQDVLDRLKTLVAGRDLVLLETMSRMHPGPETNEGLAVVASAVEQLVTATGAAFGVVRHTPKAIARDTEKEPDSYWGRGGGSFSDAARSVLNVRQDPPPKNERQDPLGPVRLTHSKPPPFSRRGDDLLWKPTLVDLNDPEGAIFLRSLSRREQAMTTKLKVVRYLRDFPDGIVKSELHNTRPANLTRGETKEAIEALVSDGTVVVCKEKRGKTTAVVFRLRLQNSAQNDEA